MLKQVIAGDLRGAQGNTGSLVTLFVSDCLDESSDIFVANLKKAAATGTWSVQQKLTAVLTTLHYTSCHAVPVNGLPLSFARNPAPRVVATRMVWWREGENDST